MGSKISFKISVIISLGHYYMELQYQFMNAHCDIDLIIRKNDNNITSGKTQQNELHLFWAKYQQKLREVVPFGDFYSY